MKSNTVFKRAYNQCLAQISAIPVGGQLGTEAELAHALGVSRTTVRSILVALEKSHIIEVHLRDKVVIRQPGGDDYYPDLETQSASDIVEAKFLRWILQEDPKPAQQINNMELARQFGVSTSAVREYLARFGQFGLLERRDNGGWQFKGFTRSFAEELTEVRDLFEIRSALKFVTLPTNNPAWASLDQIEAQHLALRGRVVHRHMEFSELDERFHRLINTVVPNRFMSNFYMIISMIFHYHYQWNKANADARNEVAIEEHLVYIAALKSGDSAATLKACKAHLETARQTLLLSIKHLEGN